MGEVAEAVVAAENALYRAMIAQDFSALRKILADDVVYIHSTAVSESKEQYLAGVAAGLYDYGSVETKSARNWVNGDVVVRTGLTNMAVGERGKPKDDTNLLCTTVWRHEAGAWRLVLRHATRVRG